MKISYNWLKKFIDLKSIDVVINKLNLSGLEVDGFYKVGDFNGVITAEIKSVSKIEGSDKLLLCKTFTGKETIDIITGDITVKEGEILPLATVDAVLPGNIKIDKKEFMGKTSYGMFCSLEELGIYNDASKIYRFSQDTKIGKDILELWDLPDYIIELEITANRGDALSHLGVARDLSALFNININKEIVNIETTENDLINNLSIETKEPRACPRYTSRVVKNVKVKESPEWMKKDLYLLDSRPINNVVDVTNYMMFNYGHPLHVFDYDLLEGHKIIVRYAKNGEKIEALNGETYDLNENVLVIADEKEPIAIAGVIGGSKKSINENTKNVVIECAYFDPVAIRRNRKEIGGLTTDSSYRFERGVDYGNHNFIVDKAAELISRLGNGKIEDKVYDVYPNKIEDRYVEFHGSDVSKYLGIPVSEEVIITILKKLGFDVSLKLNKIRAKVPTYRSDVSIMEDIVEEVGRIYGYDKVTSEIPKVSVKPVKKSKKLALIDYMKDKMVGYGFSEVINYAFAPGWVEDENLVKVTNPLSKDFSNLRNSLIYSLIENAKYNVSRQEKALSIFEIGKVYNKDLSENAVLAALMTAEKEIDWKDKNKRDIFDLKGIIEGLLERYEFEFKESKIKNLHPYQNAKVYVDGEEIGYLGKLDPKFLLKHKLDNVYVFELNIGKLLNLKSKKKYFSEFSQFPKVRKDLSIEVSEQTEIGKILNPLKTLPNLENIGVFDVYKDKKSKQVSVAIFMEFRKENSTLEDSEINELFNLAIKKVQEFKGVKIRGLD